MADIFRIASGVEMTPDLLGIYIRDNDALTTSDYGPLWDAYNNDYEIYEAQTKPAWKPDNRLSVNFARYIVDTFIGFSYGNPVRVQSDDERVQEYIDMLNAYTDEDDQLTELATIAAIFGRAYRVVYVDEEGDIGTAYLDPRDAFMIYSDGITPKPRYFVRTYKDADDIRHGSISDEYTIRYFTMASGDIEWDGEVRHGFGAVPAVELVMNRARRGIFADVLPLINTYNKALSEKANDVDYFSDAYMKVLGAELDETSIHFMRENRVINLAGRASTDVDVGFLAKPSADGTQENLLERLERQIFTIAMVCNVSSDTFITTSGIALRYKMLPMLNLSASAWRKMVRALDDYYRLVCSSPVTPLSEDAWQTLTYVHTLNFPANVLDEANTAALLDSIVSKRTVLSTLSVVDDVDAELERLNEEREKAMSDKLAFSDPQTYEELGADGEDQDNG